MESYLRISNINDFIFCPHSIYLHEVYQSFDRTTYQGHFQKRGTIHHRALDDGDYSNAKRYLQGAAVYCHEHQLMGKIDLLDQKTGVLTERKYQIKTIYDGYRYQLFAQWLCLREMGYEVKSLKLYSRADNRSYPLDLPTDQELGPFFDLLGQIRAYQPNSEQVMEVSSSKCENCIYSTLCTVRP